MKSLSMYTLALAGFLTFAIFSSSSDKEPSENQSTWSDENNRLPQRIHSINLNQTYDFAGEILPMDNFDVRERLDREMLRNAYYHSSTILALKRASRYFPLIEKILAEEGIPDDLKYLAVAESDLMNAISPAGAKGFWQFMKATGREYDLEINSEIDERYHLEKATHAACRYLKRYKEKFGSWTLAAAAYNGGAGRLSREMKAQGGTSYYDLNLNMETARYVFRIVAIKEIMKRPKDFGFDLESTDLYQPLDSYYSVEVEGAVPRWADFAAKYGISYRMLKIYNPWLISSSLTNKQKKKYVIRIPKQ
ncbi:MAG: transglycosylase SLT domain-containing protein [Bacteroidota bacterium]